MSLFKKIFFGIGIIFAVIQFIQPARNQTRGETTADNSKIFEIPDSIQTILRESCYDCHSNNTNYPFYINIQPAGWLMASHISRAKEELNFSEFGNYTQRMQISKLDGIASSIRNNIMPLPSYRLMHKKSRLDENERRLVINWSNMLQDSISSIR